MTHRHELRGENAGGSEGAGWKGIKGRKKWDNCNGIINKIYIKIKFIHLIMDINGNFICFLNLACSWGGENSGR